MTQFIQNNNLKTNIIEKEVHTEPIELVTEDDFDEVETLISRLESDIENYGRECTSGQIRSCTTSTGESGTQTCTNGVWGVCVTGGGGLNWILIIGLVIILALLVLYKFKDKIFGGGKVEEESSEWASYKF